MGVTYEQMRTVSADLYDNTLDALRRAITTETNRLARHTLFTAPEGAA